MLVGLIEKGLVGHYNLSTGFSNFTLFCSACIALSVWSAFINTKQSACWAYEKGLVGHYKISTGFSVP